MDVADLDLARALRAAELPPFFALSWFITWFAHNVADLQVCLLPLALAAGAGLHGWMAACSIQMQEC